MMSVSSNWNGDEQMRVITGDAWERVLRAAVAFWNRLQKVLNKRINPPPYRNSAPKGEPPAKRTGFGAGSVLYQPNKERMEIRVGLLGNAKYMAFHELKEHPWLLTTLEAMRPKLKEIIEGKGKS